MSVKSNVKDLIRLEPDAPYQQRARRRLVQAILDCRTVAAQSELLEEIAVQCERAYWAQIDPVRQRTLKQAVERFFQDLGDAMFSKGSLALFLENLRAQRQLLGSGVDTMRVLLARGQYTDAECRFAARQWFTLEWYRFVGETEERSVQFALLLLERIGRLTQQATDSGELAGAGLRQLLSRLGVDSEQLQSALTDPQYEALVYGALAQLRDPPEQATRRFLDEYERTPSGQVALMVDVLLECAASPTHHDTPSKWWLERLIEASSHDDVAGEVLTSVGRVLTMFRPDFRTDVFEQRDTSMEAAGEIVLERLLGGSRRLNPTETPKLILSRKHSRLLREWNDRELRADAERQAGGNAVIARYVLQRDRFRAMTEQRWTEICHRSRRGLLSKGKDHVDVHVVPLRNIGVRGIAFHPEGHEFPDVDVEIFIRKETPHLTAFRVPIAGILSMPDDILYALCHREHRDTLREMLHAVAIDAMHRIMVAEGKPRLRRSKRDASVEQRASGQTIVELEAEESERRAHFRTLPQGHQVSAEARARALEQRGWLPEGKTFVQAHYQERTLVYSLPSCETMAYTNDDLFDLGGEA